MPNERRLAPVSASFLVFGAFWGSWAVASADVERALGLSTGRFGILLSVALLGAALGNAAGGAANERWGTSRVLGPAMACWAGLVVLGGIVHLRPLLAVLMVATIGVGGLVDVSMNVAATAALSALPGHLVRFHARFNAGAAAGAALTGLSIASRHGWRGAWLGLGAAGLALAVVCTRSSLPAADRGGAEPLAGALRLLRREHLIVLALAFAAGAMVEGGVDLWGVLYLRTRLDSGMLIGAGGAVTAYAVAAGARVVLGPRAARRGAPRGVLFGAGTAALGAVVLASAPGAALAAAGLVLAAGGISMSWPLLLAQATAGRRRPGPVVGAVSAVGYLGLVAGPSLVGLVAEAVGLRWALLVLAGAAVFVALAPTLRAASPSRRPA